MSAGGFTGLKDIWDRLFASRQIAIDDLRVFLQNPQDPLEDKCKVLFPMLPFSVSDFRINRDGTDEFGQEIPKGVIILALAHHLVLRIWDFTIIQCDQ